MPKVNQLVRELLERSDLDPKTSAVHLKMEDIRSLCFNFQHLKETHPQLEHVFLDEKRLEDDFDQVLQPDSPEYVVKL